MAARLMEEPARLVCWFTKATPATVELPERENPQLVRDMAGGLIALIRQARAAVERGRDPYQHGWS